MTKSYINNKSQQVNARLPHDVLEQIESVKIAGETTAGFLVTAARGEIARRQTEGAVDNPLLSSLDALARVEEIGTKAGDEIRQLVSVARNEINRRTKN